jgi:hypothetical protein
MTRQHFEPLRCSVVCRPAWCQAVRRQTKEGLREGADLREKAV